MPPVLPCLLLLAGLLFPSVGLAALATDGTSLAGTALQTLWALSIVAGLILAIYGLARKRLSIGKLGGGQLIRVIEIRPLLPKASLALVEVRGQEFLLAISGGNIQLLSPLQTGKPGEPAEKPDQPADFSSLMAQTAGTPRTVKTTETAQNQ